MSKLYGELPLGSVIFAACDKEYFKEHATAFVTSSSQAGFNTHIHVINPDMYTLAQASVLNGITDNVVTFTFEDRDVSALNDEQLRAYYACLRFLVLPHLLQSADEILTLDIDCMVMKPFDFPETISGYYPRHDEEDPRMKVAAGAVYFSKLGKGVAEVIADSIGQLEMKWFIDQIAVSYAFTKIGEAHVTEFDSEFMDWEFKEGSCIWTGKGPRKHDNPTYVAKKKEFNDRAYSYLNSINTVLLKPRLDIPFKKFGLETAGSTMEPIRKHWANFANNITSDLTVEMPRWMFNSTIERYFNKDTSILVPHTERNRWNGRNTNTQFYMQTVFPWLFTIDEKGWSGGGKFVETFDPDAPYTEVAFDEMRKYIREGGTKFKQPESKPFKMNNKFIFVPLQIPHDETIKYHSNVGVVEMVQALCDWADSSEDNPLIVFKGHPINLASMEESKAIIDNAKRASYHTDLNIHDVIPMANAVYVINSGTGQEAMLHDASVVTFGESEYQAAVIQGDLNNLDETWRQVETDDKIARSHLYRKWYDWYINKVTFNTLHSEKNSI